MPAKSFFPPIALAVLLLAPPALAQHSAPCPYLIDTIEAKARKITAAQDRLLDMLAKEADAGEAPRARVCQAARSVIAQSEDLVQFAEKRRSRCETPQELGAFDAVIALASVSTARSLAASFCRN